jgi:hypothetical protein
MNTPTSQGDYGTIDTETAFTPQSGGESPDGKPITTAPPLDQKIGSSSSAVTMDGSGVLYQAISAAPPTKRKSEKGVELAAKQEWEKLLDKDWTDDVAEDIEQVDPIVKSLF